MTDDDVERRSVALHAARDFLGEAASAQQMMAVATWLMTGEAPERGKYAPRRDTPKKTGRQDVYAPGTWQRLGDGRWMSPKGHVYGEHTQVVQRVIHSQQQEEQRRADAATRPRLVTPLPRTGTLG